MPYDGTSYINHNYSTGGKMRKELEDLDKKISSTMTDFYCQMGDINRKIAILEKQTKKLFATEDVRRKPNPNPYSSQALVEAHIKNIVEHLESTHNIAPELAKAHINHYMDWRYK